LILKLVKADNGEAESWKCEMSRAMKRTGTGERKSRSLFNEATLEYFYGSVKKFYVRRCGERGDVFKVETGGEA